MKLPPARNLSEHVTTVTDDARAARLWARVDARAGSSASSKRGRDWRWPAVAIVVAAAAIALFVSRRTDETRVQTVEYDKNGAMTLADGSHIRLRDDGRVRVEHVDAKRIDLTLARGTAEIDVVHIPSRTFVVHAGHFDIIDLGTRFVVTLDGTGVRVVVEVGRVEVRDTTGALPSRVLGASESWSSNVAPPQATIEDNVDNVQTPILNATATASAMRPRSAKELLEAADTARVAGRVNDAAALLDNVRRRYRSDPRAGLAAFQLGRLRLDALADAAGAVEAFDDAIALSPTASFREDAEARRVEALERARDPRCREARDTYLARYHDGLRAKEVAVRCGP